MQRDAGRGSIHRGRWHGRGDDGLPFVNASLIGGQDLLLDTCVYIDQMQDRSPQMLDDPDLAATGQPFNGRDSGVDAHGRRPPPIGCANRGRHCRDPQANQGHAGACAPDVEVLGRAALLSGILCRLQGYEKDGELRALQDCALFLQAQKLGLVVLTANVGDILLQLIPTGRALFYRRK